MRYLLLIIFSAGLVFSVQSQETESLFLKASMIKLKNSKEYTIMVAELMPEEFYGFKPTAAEMSFREQLLHICTNMTWLSSSCLSSENKSAYIVEKNMQGKDSILHVLNQTYDYAITILSAVSPSSLADSVKFFAGPMNKLQIINLISDHQTHHRGQLLVYLRLCGVEPPRYVGW